VSLDSDSMAAVRVMKIMGDMSSVLSAVHLVLSSNSPEEEDAEATN